MADGQGRITLWGVEIFLTVVEEGAISAAGRRLGVSASAISQQLSAIEASLGAILIDRTMRPFAVTAAGVVFRTYAQSMLNAEVDARTALARADLSTPVTLRLGIIEDFDAQVTPQLLTALAKDFMGCRFLLETGASHRLIDQLESRALDLVVTAEYGQSGWEEGWRTVHPLMEEPFVAVFPRARDEHLPFIQYTTRHLMGRQIASHLAGQGIRALQRFELDSYQAILSMVAAEEGWTILTPLALHHGARFAGQVRVEPLGTSPLTRRLTLSVRTGTLGDMPSQVAAHLRRLIGKLVVDPAVKELPWLQAQILGQ